MSDAAAEHFQPTPQESPAAPGGRSVTVAITLHPDGQIEFSMPLGNKVVLYGLLETARAQADKLYLLQEMKHAQMSNGDIQGLLKRMKGG